MAFIVFSSRGEEIGRRPLDGEPVVIGRSPECDVAVRDILLSRRHCRLEPQGRGWVLLDLGSKNGTAVGGRRVTRQPLSDGDVLEIGKTRVSFHAGAFVPTPSGTPLAKRRRRPADPFEAMASTMTGVEVADV